MFKTLPAPSVKDVSVSRVNLSSATVNLTSKQASKVKIYYGLSEGFGGLEQVNTSTAESSYSVQLTGLNDGSTYYYKVNTVDAEGFTSTIAVVLTVLRRQLDRELAMSSSSPLKASRLARSKLPGRRMYQQPRF